ncbi:uncharacterized protein LOC113458935 [Zonotrichia albicollis]|uniref:uncharacterized protein LOC113458935 n=1 Tax=Zonotrichia albicollis TaxID=44394 RepID=UPI003D811517
MRRRSPLWYLQSNLLRQRLRSRCGESPVGELPKPGSLAPGSPPDPPPVAAAASAPAAVGSTIPIPSPLPHLNPGNTRTDSVLTRGSHGLTAHPPRRSGAPSPRSPRRPRARTCSRGARGGSGGSARRREPPRPGSQAPGGERHRPLTPQQEPSGAPPSRPVPAGPVPAAAVREVGPGAGRERRRCGSAGSARGAARRGAFAGCPARSRADVSRGRGGHVFPSPPVPVAVPPSLGGSRSRLRSRLGRSSRERSDSTCRTARALGAGKGNKVPLMNLLWTLLLIQKGHQRVISRLRLEGTETFLLLQNIQAMGIVPTRCVLSHSSRGLPQGTSEVLVGYRDPMYNRKKRKLSLVPKTVHRIYDNNPDKTCMFSAPFFGSRTHWLIANYFMP